MYQDSDDCCRHSRRDCCGRTDVFQTATRGATLPYAVFCCRKSCCLRPKVVTQDIAADSAACDGPSTNGRARFPIPGRTRWSKADSGMARPLRGRDHSQSMRESPSNASQWSTLRSARDARTQRRVGRCAGMVTGCRPGEWPYGEQQRRGLIARRCRRDCSVCAAFSVLQDANMPNGGRTGQLNKQEYCMKMHASCTGCTFCALRLIGLSATVPTHGR